jgi:signal transduction histidine kinase
MPDQTSNAVIEPPRERIAELTEQLQQTDRMATLGVLAASVAHELNNILTPVLGYAQLAQKNPDDQTLAAKALSRTATGIESARRITDAILGFAATGDDESNPNILQTFEAAMACLARDPARDGIVFEAEIPGGLRACMRATALQQVFLNLVLNACSALVGPGWIQVAAREGERDDVVITISDNGPGIPESIRDRIFEPFVTLSMRRSTEGGGTKLGQAGGTGLGLAVCRHLVEDAGGSISVETSEGGGTRFTIVLSRAD